MKTLLDIGANKGLYSLANQNLYDRFILVEPNMDLYPILNNLHLNKQIIANVVSNEKQPVFYKSNADTISTCNPRWITESRFTNSYVWKQENVIPAVTLDTLILNYNPSFIKIDVEGYELAVLHSLTQKTCPLCFEWAEELKDELIQSIKYLYVLGYKEFYLSNGDNYTFYPEEHQYVSCETILKLIDTLNPNRKSEWGMIFVK